MAEKRIDIIIAAQSMVGGAFAQASAAMRKFQEDLKGSNKHSLDFAFLLGKVAVAARAVELASKAGTAAVAAWRGEWDTLSKKLADLPIVGRPAQSVADFLESISGASDEYAKMTEQAREFGALLKAQRSAQSEIEKIAREASDAALDAASRERAVLERDHAAKIRRLHELAKLTPGLAEQAAAAVEALNRAHLKRMLDMQEEAEERKQEEAERQRKTLEELDSEIRQKSLEAQGRTLDAELERIREHYRRRIEEAETAAERERLIRLRALDEEEAKRRDLERQRSSAPSPASDAAAVASRGGVAAVSVGGSFLGLQARFAGGQDPASDTAKNTRRAVAVLESLVKKFDESMKRPVLLDAMVVRS